MIEFVNGNVVDIAAQYVVIEVQGIGYRVFHPVPARLNAGETAILYTYQHVREDAIQLYGFSSREERGVFELLIEVSGIGPKVALGILAMMPPDALVLAIDGEDIATLIQLPGVGKKTAQRLVLDLKEKVRGLAVMYGVKSQTAHQDSGSLRTALAGQENQGDTAQLLKEALLSLGYSEREAAQGVAACAQALSAGLAFEQLLRKALQALG